MKKFLKIGLILFCIGLIAGTGTYIYVFHKPHRNIAKEKPAYIVDAHSFYSEFSSDENSGYQKYGNQVIQLTGKVVNVAIEKNNASITLLDEMEGISCSFDSLSMVKNLDKLRQVKSGDEVILKGQCDGYDMLMGVVLSRCVLL